MSETKTIVVALGGNAILQPGQRGTLHEQYDNVRRSCEQLARLISLGHRVVITHGNGPQVGNILIQQEKASCAVPPMPLDVCGAESQGQIGYMIQQNLRNALAEKNIHREVVSIVTQVVVGEDDPAFQNPTKPIGPFYSEEQARLEMSTKGEKWVNDSDRGWRKVVPSPEPRRIVEKESIRALIDANHIVIASGGGGIPTLCSSDGQLRGVEAVIDKDLGALRLATDVNANVLLILTDVQKVALHFHTPAEREIDVMTTGEARRFIEEEHFRSGSMLPKVLAATRFVEQGGEYAVIASLKDAAPALHGKAGTRVIREVS